MDYKDVGYVYAITNTVNGHKYIGSTTNYVARWNTHRSALRRSKHHSFILQKAWDKHGEAAFEFSVLLVCSKEQRLFYETLAMKLQNYNVLRTPRESALRAKLVHSAETKAKMSAAHKGKVFSDAHRANMAAAARARVYDASFSEKARARQLGKILSADTRQKLSEALTGRVVSQETREKLRVTSKKATAEKAARALDKVRIIKALAKQGRSIASLLKEFKMSSATYYKYVNAVE